MPINVSNMIVNLGQAQGFDWGNFWAAGFGAIAGAIVTVGLGCLWEVHKKNEMDKQNFKKLYYSTYNLLSPSLNMISSQIIPIHDGIKSKNLKEYKEDVFKYLVKIDEEYNIDYSIAFLDKYQNYAIPLSDAVKKQIKIFNQNINSHNDNMLQIKGKKYKDLNAFEKDGNIKNNIGNGITALLVNSYLLVFFANALFEILLVYKNKKYKKNSFIDLKVDKEQINNIIKEIIKEKRFQKHIPDYLKPLLKEGRQYC